MMKKNVPFKKDIIFKTNLSEITSISLEHNIISIDDNVISGEFIINGDYRIIETSSNIEPFSFNLPFEVALDDKYILDKVTVDIDDFYYEIINNNILSVNIELLVDKLEEKPLIKTEVTPKEELSSLNINSIVELEKEEVKMEKANDLIDVFKDEVSPRSIFDDVVLEKERYVSYKVCIIKEGETIESIALKYGVDIEEIEKYNELNEIKIGDKIIIPTSQNAQV
ncbi:MAG: LysM peptidoglycan-binding domain-containing protein [Bacilli bacterium]|nr:LysM peptidoglycan-binding domain-containing protein [Bacilli bacterium]